MSTTAVPELRHMTSQPTITLSSPPSSSKAPAVPPPNTHLTPRRASPQPLVVTASGTRIPSSRPSSIPSSPTSVHSSSSAIFERDIEPISFQASPQKLDPHHTSRAQTHEPIDSSVPSVLTSAVSALSLSYPSSAPPADAGNAPGGSKRLSTFTFDDEISVISPTSGVSPSGILLSGVATPRSMSRSPSPPGGASPITRAFSLDKTSGASGTSSGPAPASTSTSLEAIPIKQGSGDSSNLSGLTGVSTSGYTLPAVGVESPSSPVRQDSSYSLGGPIPRPRRSITSLSSAVAVDEPSGLSLNTNVNKRLSFVSYHDLLLSTPTSTAPLSSITSPIDPPPHVAPVSGQISPPRGRTSPPGAVGNTNVGWGKDDGGEWEREGLGKGLEERLEEVLAAEAQSQQQSQPSSGPARG